MTLAIAKRYTKTIQRRLKLIEWDIKVEFDEGLDEDDTDGCISWQTDYKQATLKLNPLRKEQSQRETIVHELLHLLFQGHTDYSGRDPLFEFALNTLCVVLAKS